MSQTLEIVRFTVDPDRRAACLALRPAAVNALRERFGDLVDARLGEHDDGAFTDVLLWRSREAAERAAAGAAADPAVRAWFETIATVHELSHATVRAAG